LATTLWTQDLVELGGKASGRGASDRYLVLNTATWSAQSCPLPQALWLQPKRSLALQDTKVLPAELVLEHLDDNLLAASNSKKLEKSEIKFIAKRILEALQAFHEDGYVHTGIIVAYLFLELSSRLANTNQILDIKPDNILLNYGNGPSRFRRLRSLAEGSRHPAQAFSTRLADSNGNRRVQ
jgi:serine/threonine protein kinase